MSSQPPFVLFGYKVSKHSIFQTSFKRKNRKTWSGVRRAAGHPNAARRSKQTQRNSTREYFPVSKSIDSLAWVSSARRPARPISGAIVPTHKWDNHCLTSLREDGHMFGQLKTRQKKLAFPPLHPHKCAWFQWKTQQWNIFFMPRESIYNMLIIQEQKMILLSPPMSFFFRTILLGSHRMFQKPILQECDFKTRW